jgi:PAS domain S-box-containing protein
MRTDQTGGEFAHAGTQYGGDSRLKLALDAALLGTWERNLLTGEDVWSERQEVLFGLAPGTFNSSHHSFLEAIYSEDRQAVEDAAQRAIAGESRYQSEYRIRLPDGSIHWMIGRGDVIRDATGRAVRMIGVTMDVTERRVADQRLATEHAVGRVPSDSSSLLEAAPRILEAICQTIGWQFAALWTVDRQRNCLRCVEVWQHGDGAYVPDPGNREANGELFARGQQPVNPGTYDRETWDRIRGAKALPSASDLIPRRSVPPVPYEGEMTRGMQQVAALAKLISTEVLHKPLTVVFSGNENVTCSAQCGPEGAGAVGLTFHVKILGDQWFSERPVLCRENLDLVYHELGHHAGAQDCTRDHCNQVTLIAASVSVMLQTKPELFAKFR